MKKALLLLLPLLGACAPTMTVNNTPFRPGQTWALNSQSALDKKLPASTTFTVQSVKPDDGDWDIDAKEDVHIYYSPDDDGSAVLLVFDGEPLNAGADHLRVCALDAEPGVKTIVGTATHTTYENIRKFKRENIRTEALKLLSENPANTADLGLLATRSVARAVDPGDVSPCTLTLQN